MTSNTPAILLDMVAKEQSRRDSEKSLMAFVKSVWDIIEPGEQFRDNWHLHAIAEHLEAIYHGQLGNLVIAIPPGCMKSILVSVCWPAWVWLHSPEKRFFGASYGADLAIRDALKCRDIITSEFYEETWGDRVKIRDGEDQKLKYALTAGGWRLTTSVGGRGTGEHPDYKIVDDPHNAKQAESDAERETAIEWFDRTLSTRGKSRGAKTIVVAQRLHERDITGHILADLTGYDYLCMPMEYDGNKRVTSIGWSDPRKEENELLWPEMFPRESVDELKQILGIYGTSGQLQQDPTPPEGGILKTKHFKLWPKEDDLPQFEYIIQSYDCAQTEKTSGDPSACSVWAVFTYKGARNIMLIDTWSEHLGYPDLRAKVIREWGTAYGKANNTNPFAKPKRADMVLVEGKSSGLSIIQDLRLAKVPAAAYNPGKADKIARANITAPTLELGLIWIPESKKNPGKPVTWAAKFLHQIAKFPRGEHDDYVDTFTQVVIYLKNEGWFTLPVAKEAEKDPHVRKPIINPYAV